MKVIYKGQLAEIIAVFGAGLYEIRIIKTGKIKTVSEESLLLTYMRFL